MPKGAGYGPPCSRMRVSNSSRNFWIIDCTGSAAASPSAQIVVPSPIGGYGAIAFTTDCSSCRSLGSPRPSSILRRMRSIHGVPSRQGVHWPQDSSA